MKRFRRAKYLALTEGNRSPQKKGQAKESRAGRAKSIRLFSGSLAGAAMHQLIEERSAIFIPHAIFRKRTALGQCSGITYSRLVYQAYLAKVLLYPLRSLGRRAARAVRAGSICPN
jgi:hypothetical protein